MGPIRNPNWSTSISMFIHVEEFAIFFWPRKPVFYLEKTLPNVQSIRRDCHLKIIIITEEGNILLWLNYPIITYYHSGNIS